MSKARETLSKKNEGSSFSLTWLHETSQFLLANGLMFSSWLYMNARHIGWFVVTTGMITALPLILEINREASAEEIEKAQIESALAEGKTPQELAMSGLTGAVEPKVLN